VLSAVRVRVAVAVPPAGTVTGLGRMTLTPVGAAPTQEADKATSELKLFTDVSVNVTDCEAPGFKPIVDEAGCARKSADAGGTRIAGVPTMFTVTCVVCEMPAPDAVTSSEYVPVEAVFSAVRVSVDVAVPPAGTVTGLGSTMLTPDGVAPIQEVDKATGELKPFNDDSVSVSDWEPPMFNTSEPVDDCARKSGETEDATTDPPDRTFNVSVVLCDVAPLVAVIVRGYVPIATVAGTKMESVAVDVVPAFVAIEFCPSGDVPEPELNVPVTPVGPDSESVTGEAKFACEPTSTVTVPVDPCAMVTPVDERPSEKSPEYSMNPQELAWQAPLA